MTQFVRPDVVTPRGKIEVSIVPKDSIAGRALVSVVAIMTFLASLTTGAVMLVLGSASQWQSDIAREMTIQVRPMPNRDIDVDVAKSVEIARAVPGIAEVLPYSREQSAQLLEPWLGSGLNNLPVPRIIVVRIDPASAPDVSALRTALSRQVAGATLDDHRSWVGRMRAIAGAALAIGGVVLALVLVATILSVAFATRGAMAANRPIIEVLHFIGATDGYIANQFQRHFLMLGLQGGAIGGGAAIVLFALAQLTADRFMTTAGGEEVAALFGSFSIGLLGYALIIAQVAVNAAISAGTSREVVNRMLATVGDPVSGSYHTSA